MELFSWQMYSILVFGIGVDFGRAQTCDPATCSLPSCFCPKAGTPGGLSTTDIPQIVLFMFDGSVTSLHYPHYEALFNDNRLNPNGCPIGGTVFVSHNFTDYSSVRKLYLQGLEIGVNSVTRPLSDAWKNAGVDMIKDEILTQKENIIREARVPEDEIWGWRSPNLQSAGRNQFRVLQLNNFEYDSTVVTTGWSGNTNILGWPFTLDYPYPERCQIAPCPSEPYEGLWEVPIVPFQDIKAEGTCSYLEGCTNQPTNKAEVLTFLKNNFEANYKGTRAPVYINLRISWLATESYNREGIIDFINELVALDDVYILTAHQLLAWVKNPQTLAHAKDFAPWSCPDFVNNNINIWDQIKSIFVQGTGKDAVVPEAPATTTPRPSVQIIYVSENGSESHRGSCVILGLTSFVLMAMKLF
ncbi:chitin deacetylase 1-like [Liolophura sinensis]|uniref:chitin deacetylase 1-like n=1 Tax=Liolophura sinensis TaxID=3198878 RepID=UPI003158FF45